MTDAPSRSPANRSRWRGLLLNRFVLVPGALALIAALWNVYVDFHDHGLVAGRVVDAAGRPVEGATVVLWVLDFTTYVETSSATTGPDGTFRIRDNPSHNIQIGAEKPGVGRSTRIPVRLYFRAEDVTLRAPLVLSGGG
jgi:hypothetical protein